MLFLAARLDELSILSLACDEKKSPHNLRALGILVLEFKRLSLRMLFLAARLDELSILSLACDEKNHRTILEP
ncbi:MAG: hypothetical protein MR878_08155 [Campylobacter sp.]|nr:hypothetical protein [Campylobacter sp.]